MYVCRKKNVVKKVFVKMFFNFRPKSSFAEIADFPNSELPKFPNLKVTRGVDC